MIRSDLVGFNLNWSRQFARSGHSLLPYSTGPSTTTTTTTNLCLIRHRTTNSLVSAFLHFSTVHSIDFSCPPELVNSLLTFCLGAAASAACPTVNVHRALGQDYDLYTRGRTSSVCGGPDLGQSLEHCRTASKAAAAT